MRAFRHGAGVIALVLSAISGELAGAPGASAAEIGPETGLPLPRFVSLKSGEVNVRRGPGRAHKVDWIFVRRGAPVEITAEYGHWRRVRDRDGAGGWVHYSLLRGRRTAIVTDSARLREEPLPDAVPVADAEPGVIGVIDECEKIYCLIEAEGYEGWIDKTALWGVRPGEVID